MRDEAPLVNPRVSVYRVPTDAPEADGTLAWDSTTLVLVELSAGGQRGLGYTYAAAAAGAVIRDTLIPLIEGGDAFDPGRHWNAMRRALRNQGQQGIGATALSAVDLALWDLKARLLELPLARLLGQSRDGVEAYGSGGFTSYDDDRLAAQLAAWVEQGCRAVKMKVGSQPERDTIRVRHAREAIGPAELYVDANGALTVPQALACAVAWAPLGVTWFEEPVSSEDRAGLALLRRRMPAGMAIAAGEYGWSPADFRALLAGGCVDILQADATRCGGVTGFLRAAALADAWMLPLSTHCAPALHLPLACAAPRMGRLEWFHDHARIEALLFDGAPRLSDGRLRPDAARPGFGLELKAADASRFAI